MLKDKYDELAAVTGEKFNVFSILGVETAEVKHSAILADLLNPQGLHGQGATFLKLFLEITNLGDYENLETFRVRTEVSTDNKGRIDILLEKNDACIVIENKIYAEMSASVVWLTYWRQTISLGTETGGLDGNIQNMPYRFPLQILAQKICASYSTLEKEKDWLRGLCAR